MMRNYCLAVLVIENSKSLCYHKPMASLIAAFAANLHVEFSTKNPCLMKQLYRAGSSEHKIAWQKLLPAEPF